MALRIKVRGQYVRPIAESISMNDAIDERVNTLSFMIRGYGDEIFEPQGLDDVIMTQDDIRVFGGTITKITQTIQKDGLVWLCECQDFAFRMDAKLVTERYQGSTVEHIIQDIANRYAPGYTTRVVGGDIEIASIAFNRIPTSQCLKKLAQLLNYSWFVDEHKVINFYPLQEQRAPYELGEELGNHIYNSLSVSRDWTQIRNAVYVRGENQEGVTRTIDFQSEAGKKNYATIVNFAERPLITLNGVDQTVGIEGVTDAEGSDVLWNPQGQYITFDKQPPANRTIALTGKPLLPVFARVPTFDSIGKLGEFESKITDKTIATTMEAIQRGKIEGAIFGSPIITGTFKTYKVGLRSGQYISIRIPSHNVDIDVIIESVKVRLRDYKGLRLEYTAKYTNQ